MYISHVLRNFHWIFILYDVCVHYNDRKKSVFFKAFMKYSHSKTVIL